MSGVTRTGRGKLSAVAGIAAAIAVLGGCSATTSVNGGPVVVTARAPGGSPSTFQLQPVTPGAGPPPGMEPVSIPPGPPGIPPSGAYRGEMVSINDPGGRCTPRVPLFNWTVRGTRVRFGTFRGTIEPNGVLNMQGRGSYISGQFYGPHFVGEFWSPGPSCDYRLTLSLV